MTPSDSVVCVVDDDRAVGQVAVQVLASPHRDVRWYASAEAFLAEYDGGHTDCVVADLHMPGMNGVQLCEHLQAMHSPVSIVVLTGRADVRTTVKLMESGVLTLVEKPYAPIELIQAVERGVRNTVVRRESWRQRSDVERRFALLTADERDVLRLVVAGLPNKAISTRLVISPRTLDRRRRTIFKKMGVRTASEIALLIGYLRSDGWAVFD